MNTRILPLQYDYAAPDKLDDALDILDGKPNVKILAGGTDLIVKLKIGAPIAVDTMLDIKNIKELHYAQKEGEAFCIGALARLSELEKHSEVQKDYPALYEAIKAMAAVSIRNMATMAGNFCNASPVADTVGPAMCYNASVTLSSKSGVRVVPLTEFFTDLGTTLMRPDELLTRITLPKVAANTGAAFLKKGRVKADIAKISVTCVITRDGGGIASCRIAMGSVAATPLYLRDISDGLAGKEMNSALLDETAEKCAAFIKPIDDNRTTAEYRTYISGVMVREALQTAWERSGGTVK